jgi:predicted NAD/FAD-dependent oxidoreductase
MAHPRIAVIGGGLAGSLCSLVLRNRGFQPTLIDAGRSGVGGRLRNNGAQFLRTRDPRLSTVFGMMESQGLLAQWKGRFGMLGSLGGGFLPAEVVSRNMGMSSRSGDDHKGGGVGSSNGGASEATDGGDFCHFVAGSNLPTYVGTPSMTELCPQVCQRVGIELFSNTTLVKAKPVKEGGWSLELTNNSDAPTPVIDPTEYFDALVLATHDPSLASRAIRSIMDSEVSAGGFTDIEAAYNAGDDASLVIGRLGDIADSLQHVRDNDRVAVFAVSLTFPERFSSRIPFDAVSIPGSQIVQFLLREGSKPGYVERADGETWTAITTSRFASLVIGHPDQTDEDKRKQVCKAVTYEIQKLVASYSEGTAPEPLEVSAKSWSSAFCSRGLQLQEDSIFLAPWRLAVCGDFIRDLSAYSNPLEAAALSGMEAGERTAALWAGQG